MLNILETRYHSAKRAKMQATRFNVENARKMLAILNILSTC